MPAILSAGTFDGGVDQVIGADGDPGFDPADGFPVDKDIRAGDGSFFNDGPAPDQG